MSEVRYDARPSLLRMRPVATLVMLGLLCGGLAVAFMVDHVVPAQLLAQVDTPTLQVVGAVITLAAALQLLTWWLSCLADRFVIRGEEMLWTHGLLSRQFVEINLGSVRTVQVNQSLAQRLLNAGDIRIYTAGDKPELIVRGLPGPERIRRLVRPRAVG